MFSSDSAKRTVVHRYDENDTRRASSRGIIPKAKIKTVKMTFVIVFGKYSKESTLKHLKTTFLYYLTILLKRFLLHYTIV